MGTTSSRSPTRYYYRGDDGILAKIARDEYEMKDQFQEPIEQVLERKLARHAENPKHNSHGIQMSIEEYGTYIEGLDPQSRFIVPAMEFVNMTKHLQNKRLQQSSSKRLQTQQSSSNFDWAAYSELGI